MNAVVKTLGKMLRLVGISSPEDALPKARAAGDPPSWRATAQQKAHAAKKQTK